MLSIFNRYKRRNYLFYISKCSGDIIISRHNMEKYAIFCTRIEFTKNVCDVIRCAEIKNIEIMSMGMTYRTH